MEEQSGSSLPQRARKASKKDEGGRPGGKEEKASSHLDDDRVLPSMSKNKNMDEDVDNQKVEDLSSQLTQLNTDDIADMAVEDAMKEDKDQRKMFAAVMNPVARQGDGSTSFIIRRRDPTLKLKGKEENGKKLLSDVNDFSSMAALWKDGKEKELKNQLNQAKAKANPTVISSDPAS